jgi:hypothetical protein
MIFPFLNEKNPCRKKLRFYAVVAPEGRRLCINFTLSQPLTAPQISPAHILMALRGRKPVLEAVAASCGGFGQGRN